MNERVGYDRLCTGPERFSPPLQVCCGHELDAYDCSGVNSSTLPILQTRLLGIVLANAATSEITKATVVSWVGSIMHHASHIDTRSYRCGRRSIGQQKKAPQTRNDDDRRIAVHGA